MKTRVITLMAIVAAIVAVTATPLSIRTRAQTQNHSTKTTITESFVFPNECTEELMDVTDTTTVTCHQQQRADGTFIEKCEIRQDVTATGQVTGIVWHGTATFKDEFVANDGCNFSFSNRGRVHLISPGSSVNTIVTFDELVKMENCVLTTDQHLVSFDCRGAGKP